MASPPLFVRDRLRLIEAAGLLRRPPTIETQDGVRGRVNGKSALLFCSNDYLGLRLDPAIRRAAASAAEQYGGGSGSSRLIAGSLAIHDRLEEAVARWLGTETALVCSSGYQANLALVQGLCQSGDLILSDGLNHASLIDGCRLSRARVVVMDHGSPGSATLSPAGDAGQVFRLGEGLYSMDGDRGPVEAWVGAAAAEGSETSHVLVDEAHALGVFGPEGQGVCAERGVANAVLARVGTFGKAVGAHGAFIACSAATRELLVNTGRTYIFTTGLPPAAAGAALAGIEVVSSERGDELRATLQARASQLRSGLSALGFEVVGDADAPIVPVLIGPANEAMKLYSSLLDRGIYAMAIRPPTVPDGTCRLRFTVSAAHSEVDVDAALSALSEL